MPHLPPVPIWARKTHGILVAVLLQFLAIPAVEYTLLAAYLVIGVSITVDVLLKRSDVRAAMGWIAAAWLSPFLGGALYFLFGINRVERRALKLARRAVRRGRRTPVARPPVLSEPITLLSQVGERITAAPWPRAIA